MESLLHEKYNIYSLGDDRYLDFADALFFANFYQNLCVIAKRMIGAFHTSCRGMMY